MRPIRMRTMGTLQVHAESGTGWLLVGDVSVWLWLRGGAVEVYDVTGGFLVF